MIPIKNKLDNSHRGENPSLNRILDAYLKKQGKHKPYLEPGQTFFWDSEYFHLDKSTLFRGASKEQKRLILERCTQDLVSESYFVEKSAAAYCGKMMLLAETTEIAQVYSMIANEEAIHLQWITPYMDLEARHSPEGPFLKFLSSLIETCDFNLLPYLVQIILEGWGLHHYKRLANGCLNDQLKSVFLAIVRDEALHHHAGEVIFDASKASPEQHLFIEDCLKTFADMVRMGPQQIVTAVDEVMGGISLKDKKRLLIDIGAEDAIAEKLNLLKELMLQPGVEKTVQKLELTGYFSPQGAR